jgi:hypothetical protein
MVRKFITPDGEILEESEWDPTPIHTCFYCDAPLIYVQNTPCPSGLLNLHDFVSIVEPVRY